MPIVVKFLINIAIGLILQAIAWMLTDPPPGPTPGTLDDVGFPKTREGSDAGLVFGFVHRTSDSIFHHWYGDFDKREIRNNVGKKG